MQLLIDDNFNRPNTSAGGAGSTTGAGNGWIDKHGSTYSISGNKLNAIPQSPNAYLTSFLARPDAEKFQDQQITLDVAAPNFATDQNAVALRYQSGSGNFYYGQAYWGSGGFLTIYKVVGGSATQLGQVACSALTAGHSFELTCAATGISPTTLSATLTDTTASAVVATLAPFTDSEATLQTTGAAAIDVNGPNGNPTSANMNFSRLRVYNTTAAEIAIGDANLFFTGNWYVNGSIYAQSQNAGAYFKTGFTGTDCWVALDLSPLVGGSVAAANYPLVIYSVDGGAWQQIQLANGLPTIPVAIGVAGGNHTLQLMILATSRTDDRWNGPANCVRIIGLFVDGGSASAAPALLPNRLLYFGDSIGEGDLVLGNANNSFEQDVRYAPAFCLQLARQAEVANISFASQGWVESAAASGNVPAFESAWNLFDANHSRLSSGRFAWMPDDIVICQGVNDAGSSISGAAVTAAVQSTLAAIRAAGPRANIFVVIPACGAMRSAITAGFADYQAATPDAIAHLIDRGTLDQAGLNDIGTGVTFASSDGVHPFAFIDAQLEAHTASLMAAAILAGVVSANIVQISAGVLSAIAAAAAGSGTGDTAINQDSGMGGMDSLRYVNNQGVGIAGATILIYLATDWPNNPANVQARSTTGADGRWALPCFVGPGTYVAVFYKQGVVDAGAEGADASGPFTIT